MTADKIHTRALKVVRRRSLCSVRQSECGIERTGVDARLCRHERPIDTTNRVCRQGNRALQERSRSGEASARLCAPSRALELGSDILVGAGCCAGAVPRTPIGIILRIGGFGQREMYTFAICG